MVFSATQQYFSYIVAVNLLVEETGENHRPAGSDWPALSNNVVSNTTRLSGIRTHKGISFCIFKLLSYIVSISAGSMHNRILA
jgi:D-alanyl-lipoteichoic acid acyltransferase DltB (MBOAT superfamily)